MIVKAGAISLNFKVLYDYLIEISMIYLWFYASILFIIVMHLYHRL